jgi:predicted N-acyltransferase
LTPFGALFTGEAYLSALHDSGAASAENGWTFLNNLEGLAEAPCYLKAHSWGEFVFDFEFARAYQQYGLAYYPKLVCAVPFTPVTGPRLGAHVDSAKLLTLCEQHCASSAHVLFLPDEEADLLAAQGWLRRHDLRFVWHNRGYGDFEEFLAALASKKRKNIRAERRKVQTLNLDIRWQRAGEFSPVQWDEIYALYASTYAMRGQAPYLNQDCLMRWAKNLPEQFLFCVASQGKAMLAMAFFFCDGERLYGRHWGSLIEADSLHFELCYYRAIEYCIAQGLSLFDAGVQGDHRLLRGFEPCRTQSMHSFADARFSTAIGDFLARERAMQAQRLAIMQEKTAFAVSSR